MLFRATTDYEKSYAVKISLYNTLIRPTLTYAYETWTTSKNNAYALDSFKKKILRRVYGPRFNTLILDKVKIFLLNYKKI